MTITLKDYPSLNCRFPQPKVIHRLITRLEFAQSIEWYSNAGKRGYRDGGSRVSYGCLALVLVETRSELT